MERTVWRYRAPAPLEMVVEIIQPDPEKEGLLYRRLFEGEVVVEKPISPEAVGQLWTHLVARGWRSE